MVQEWATWPGRKFLVALLVLSLATGAVKGQLTYNYYATTCPDLDNLARQAFMNRVTFFNIISLPANILRLAFHDCAVDGCEGSVLLSSTPDGSITDEKLSFKNVGIGNIPVITYMKQQIDAACNDAGAPVVSCADVVALAGREAFNFAKVAGNLGTQIIPIPLGRRDGLSAQTSHADAQLLGPETTIDQLLENFDRIGLTIEQSVALVGSHTIGIAHCVNIVPRLYPTPDATLSSVMGLGLAAKLRLMCPENTYSPTTVVNNDPTNTIFDNEYFVNVMTGQGLMAIDDNLRLDNRTSGFAQNFALNPTYFYEIFAQAYGVLTSWRALTGDEGQIRTDCTQVNS
ncbi:unnamed protein product [Calypogeia fissa]